MEPTTKIDPLESKLHSIDSAVADQTGTSLLNWLTAGSIIASIYLYSTGRKQLGIFIRIVAAYFSGVEEEADELVIAAAVVAAEARHPFR